MKDKKRQNGRDDDAPDIGVVRVFSNPGPDAGDRLRRLITLMVRYATKDTVTSESSDIAIGPSRGETIVLEDASPPQDLPEGDD